MKKQMRSLVVVVSFLFAFSISAVYAEKVEIEMEKGQDLAEVLTKDGKGVQLYDYHEIKYSNGIYAAVTFLAPKKAAQAGRSYFIEKIVRRCLGKGNSSRIKVYMVTILADPDIVIQFEIDVLEIKILEGLLKDRLNRPNHPIIPNRLIPRTA